jgi:hypothetical protein
MKKPEPNKPRRGVRAVGKKNGGSKSKAKAKAKPKKVSGGGGGSK